MTNATQNQPAPRVTPERIDALVASLSFETARVPNTSTTVATARLPNGFMVTTGQAACVSPGVFDAAESRRLAIEDATAKARDVIVLCESYKLAQQLAGEGA